MRQCEGRHYFEHVYECFAKSGHRFPPTLLEPQYRRQQQRQQEQNMVEARPDVPNAVPAKDQKIVGRSIELEAMNRMVAGKDGRLSKTVALDLDEPAIQRLQVEHKTVIDFQQLRTRQI